jgi:DNA-binding NtrC family response regulator
MTGEQSYPMKGENRSESRDTQERGYAMGPERQAQEGVGKVNASLQRPSKPRILIVSDDDPISELLEVILLHTGLASTRVMSMAAACEAARSGRFQVVVTTPALSDGTWKRLTDLASRYRPGFVVIVVAITSDPKQRVQALEEGVFDVVALHELPNVAWAVRRALWAAYLDGAGPRPEAPSHSRVG